MRVAELHFTKAELRQLMSYCESRDETGWYYGKRKDFELRHHLITMRLDVALNELENYEGKRKTAR